MNFNNSNEPDDLTPFQIHSRREIVSLLRNIAQYKLVRIHFDNGQESIAAPILEIDEASERIIIEAPPGGLTVQRVLGSENISFETALDNIRILFFAARVESCDYDNRLAFSVPIPPHLIRLQRREYYRVLTPVTNPVRCVIQIPNAAGKISSTAIVPLYNISAGGIAVTDEKRVLSAESGHVYWNSRIDLPGSSVVVALELRDAQEIPVSSLKSIRRIGFQFIEPSSPVLATIQRYITRLERDQNARVSGLG